MMRFVWIALEIFAAGAVAVACGSSPDGTGIGGSAGTTSSGTLSGATSTSRASASSATTSGSSSVTTSSSSGSGGFAPCTDACTGCCAASGSDFVCIPLEQETNDRCAGAGTGSECIACNANDKCQSGACVPLATCDVTNCLNGCCAGTTCVPYASQSNGQCASGGLACASCGTGLQCANGRCLPGVATLTWELNGSVLGTDTFFLASYVTSQDAVSFIMMGGSAVEVLIGFPKASTVASVSQSCPGSSPSSDYLIRSDTSSDMLPLAWQNLGFSGCSAAPDTILSNTLTASVSPTHVSGSFDVDIQGGGPRAGSTVHIHGTFDVNPTAM